MKVVRSGLFAVVAGAMAVSLSAQTPPPNPDQPASRANRDDKVTVTGCLERSKESASPTGTSGTAASGASASAKFVLNNVTSTPSASGTAGTAGSASTASSYRLDGEDSKLSPHVGHKVEITGTVAKEASATGTTMSASAPKLKVESVKMVSNSCTP